jgi:hypothetical protein
MKNIKGIVDISGFGKYTGYEKACQNMLQAGWKWMSKNKKEELKGHTYTNIYGIFEPDNKATEELSQVIAKAEPDCSGAMHQAVFGHLMYINKYGLEKWKKKVKEKK